ncbi:MAG: hypothetical protein KC925_04125, partial [Candidatus Doudnabacteria bacterium]|nr:hypothetical protein [Candidatus Doudnabacteria bacterium]
GVEGYNAVTRLLLGEYNRSEQPRTLKTLEDCMHRVRHTYAELEHILTGPSPQDEAAKKCEAAKSLSLAASHAVTLLSKEEPAAMSAFAGQVVRL